MASAGERGEGSRCARQERLGQLVSHRLPGGKGEGDTCPLRTVRATRIGGGGGADQLPPLTFYFSNLITTNISYLCICFLGRRCSQQQRTCNLIVHHIHRSEFLFRQIYTIPISCKKTSHYFRFYCRRCQCEWICVTYMMIPRANSNFIKPASKM